MKICSNCNLEYEDKFAFCHKCGSKLQVKIDQSFCPYCGNSIETDGEFCPFCGNTLKDDETSDGKGLNSSVPVNEYPASFNTTNDTNNTNNQDEEKSSSGWVTAIEIVILLIGAIFSKSCARAMLKSDYRGPFAIFSFIVVGAFLLYILYQVISSFLKKSK